MDVKFYISGLQRSGTNYLSSLLIENFFEFSHCNGGFTSPGWKHHIEPVDGLQAHVDSHKPAAWFMIYKNPYTWVESLCHRNRVDYKNTQKMFGAADGNGFIYGSNSLNVEHLAKTWNHWTKKWLLETPPCVENMYAVKYESLLDEHDRNHLLDKVCNDLELKRKHNNYWQNIEFGKVTQSPRFDEEKIKYYKNVEHNLPQKVVNIINQHIEQKCFDVTGYSPIAQR